MSRYLLAGIFLLSGCVPSQPASVPSGSPAPSTGRSPADSNAANGATQDVKAGVGVGERGRALDGHSGLIVTPARSLFAAKEKIAFEIAIPHALNLYNAAEGNYPRSHDEFMERVVKANNIVLPKLPEGHSYVYDVESHELMVRRPVPASQPLK